MNTDTLTLAAKAIRSIRHHELDLTGIIAPAVLHTVYDIEQIVIQQGNSFAYLFDVITNHKHSQLLLTPHWYSGHRDCNVDDVLTLTLTASDEDNTKNLIKMIETFVCDKLSSGDKHKFKLPTAQRRQKPPITAISRPGYNNGPTTGFKKLGAEAQDRAMRRAANFPSN